MKICCCVIRGDRKKYSEQIENLFRLHGRKYIKLNGSYQERYEAAVREVEKLLGTEEPETI